MQKYIKAGIKMDEKAGRKLIAERAGVSKTTVTRVLSGNASVSEKTQKKVMNVIEELGYTQNKLAINLSRNKNSNFIAMLVPDMTNYYYLQMFDTITRLLDGTDYTISVYRVTEQNWTHMLDQMLKYRVAAVINMLFYPVPTEYMKKFDCARIKVIHPDIPNDLVRLRFDYAPAIREAFESMRRAGRKNFYFLCGMNDEYIVDGRIVCYLELMREIGVSKPEETVLWGDYPHVSALQAGYDLIKRLHDCGGDADALFCMTDMTAFGAIKALRELGKEPGRDVSVVGFDNILLGEYSQPTLSTIDSFLEEEARRYVDFIFDREYATDLIVSKYIERGSIK